MATVSTASGVVRSYAASFLTTKRITALGISASTFTTNGVSVGATSIGTVSAGLINTSVTTQYLFAHNATASDAMYLPMGFSVNSAKTPGSFSVGTVSSNFAGCLALMYGIRSHVSLSAAAGMSMTFVANGSVISRRWLGDYFNTGSAALTFSAREGVPINSFRKNNYFNSITDETFDSNVILYNDGPSSALGTPAFRGFRIGPSGTVVWCSVSGANLNTASLTLFFLMIPSLTSQ